MESKMNKKEAKKYLQEFLTKINTQDNRGTASPYFYVIQDKEEYRDDNNPEYYVWFNDEYDEKYRSDYEDDLIEKIMERDNIDQESAEEYLSKFDKCGMSTRWIEDGCFFTEEDAKGHLESNSHHYSKDARTYVKHFWRAPGVKDFFEAVSVLVELPIKQH
jgi:hypothetical protein